MCEVYYHFAQDWHHCQSFTDQDKVDLYNHESYGTPLRPNNGYALGKKWLNVTVAAWLEDISLGTLFKHELYQDPNLPHWWLDRIFKDPHV